MLQSLMIPPGLISSVTIKLKGSNEKMSDLTLTWENDAFPIVGEIGFIHSVNEICEPELITPNLSQRLPQSQDGK